MGTNINRRFTQSLLRKALGAAFCLTLLPAESAFGAASIGQPIVNELRVNGFTTEEQLMTHMAMQRDGDYVVIWRSRVQDGSNYGVFARHYGADGLPKTGEIAVNTYTTGSQTPVDLAMDEAGNFVVAWQSVGQDGSEAGIFVRSFNADASPRTGEIQVNTITAGAQSQTKLAMNRSGEFVFLWRGPTGVFAKAFHADATEASGEIVVDPFVGLTLIAIDVAVAASGDFVVAWSSDNSGDALRDLFVSTYDLSGSSINSKVSVHPDVREGTHLLMNESGQFAVIFIDSDPRPGTITGSIARTFNADGSPARSVFAITTDRKPVVDVEIGSDGRLLSGWSPAGGVGTDANVRVFGFNGSPLTPLIRANTFTSSNEEVKHVALAENGDFVVVWDQSSSAEVFTRSYDPAGSPLTPPVRLSLGLTGGSEHGVGLYMNERGDYVVAWTRLFGGDDIVLVQAFHAGGAAASPEIEAVASMDSLTNPILGIDPDGDFSIAWNSEDDGDGSGVFTRSFTGFEDVDLSIQNEDSLDPVAPASALSYALHVENQHPGDLDPAIGIANAVKVSDPLPPGMAYAGFAGSDWSCAEAAGTVECALGVPLLAGESSTVTLNVVSPAPGEAVNTASVSGRQYDAQTANDSEAETTSVFSCPTPSHFVLRNATPRALESATARGVYVDRTASNCGSVQVDFAAFGMTATDGEDLEPKAGTLSWAHGDSAGKKFNLRLLPDVLDEPNETVRIELSNPTAGATVGAAGTMTIMDDDDPPTVSITGDSTAAEGDDVSFTLMLDAPSSRDITVRLALSGTATIYEDYRFRDQRVVIPAGSSSVTRDLRAGAVDVVEDGVADSGETIVVSITQADHAGVSMAVGSFTVTLTD